MRSRSPHFERGFIKPWRDRLESQVFEAECLVNQDSGSSSRVTASTGPVAQPAGTVIVEKRIPGADAFGSLPGQVELGLLLAVG